MVPRRRRHAVGRFGRCDCEGMGRGERPARLGGGSIRRRHTHASGSVPLCGPGPRVCRLARNNPIQESGGRSPDGPGAPGDSGVPARARAMAHRAPTCRLAGDEGDDRVIA